MSKIGDFCDRRGHVYLSGTGDPATDEIRLSFVEADMQAWRDFRPSELRLLQSMIDDALQELCDTHEVKCPACGYTSDDCGVHGHHRLCRQFPFFPGETGKSEAVERTD